jgi:bifunctional DNase/RNase
MISVKVETLIMSQDASPSILVLTANDSNHESIEIDHRFIPIWIGLPEAAQIGLALEDIRLPRPLTHDLFINAISSLDAYVDHVLITEVKGSTFYATLTLRQHGHLIELDARPSDAIALALKQGADIFVLDSVFKKASFPFQFNANKEEEDLKKFHEFVSNLNPDDFLNQ